MVCPKCGNKMKSGAKFCGKCGAALNGGGQGQAKAPSETPKVSKGSVGRNKLLLGGVGLLVLCAAVLLLFVPAGLFASSKPRGDDPYREEEKPAATPDPDSWEMSGLEDHEMAWNDSALEGYMRQQTKISEGPIMLSDAGR